MADPRIRLSEPTVGDEEAQAAARAVRDGHLVFGPDLPAFEAALAAAVGAHDAVATVTGTAALHLALVTAGVGPGDEVWVSDLTFIASVNAVSYCGARVVLVDSEPRSWNLDPEVVADEITRRAKTGVPMPKAIVPVHMLGHPADLAPVLPLLAEHGIAIVEDAAESLGSRWVGGALDGRAPGSVGDLGIYSFNFNKPISTGGGGMLVARDPEVLARARHLGTPAKIPDTDYRHDAIGYNDRLSNVAAAIGVIQMQRLGVAGAGDNRRRGREIAANLDPGNLELMPEQREHIVDDRVDVHRHAFSVVRPEARQVEQAVHDFRGPERLLSRSSRAAPSSDRRGPPLREAFA